MHDKFIVKGNNKFGIIKDTKNLEKFKIYNNKIDIIAGDFIIVNDVHDISIHTLLGSCVAICFYDIQTGYTGVNHFLTPIGEDFRSGIYSTDSMLQEMIKLGVNIEDIECKVYGGANVNNLKLFNSSIGTLNADFAFKYCKEKNINIKQHIVKGKRGLILLIKPLFLTTYKEM